MMYEELRLPHMIEGFVYILRNKGMPGLVKIGMTTRSPDVRAKELSDGTGVPHPFEVHYVVKVSDCRAVEKKLHISLDGFRVNNRREFFKMSLGQARRRVKQAAAAHYLKDRFSSRKIKILSLVIPVILLGFMWHEVGGLAYFQSLWEAVKSGQIMAMIGNPSRDFFYSSHNVVMYAPVIVCLLIASCFGLKPTKRDRYWFKVRKKNKQNKTVKFRRR